MQVQFDGIQFVCSDDDCEDIIYQITNPLPSGDEGLSKRIYFNFGSLGKSINFTRQKIGSEYPLYGYFKIDSEIPEDFDGRDDFTNYYITNHDYPSYTPIWATVTRESTDIWHIVVSDLQCVYLLQGATTYTQICNNRGCSILVTPHGSENKGIATLKPFDFYFVREPAQ